MGRTPTSISYWEAGRRAPGLNDVVRLAGVLGVKPADLLPHPSARAVADRLAWQLGVVEIGPIVGGLVDRFAGVALPDPSPPGPTNHPVELAEFARDKGGQEVPPVTLEPIMQALGVINVEEPMPDSISSMVVFVEGAPIVAVRRQDPPPGKRFAAARALGHALMALDQTVHVNLSRPEVYPASFSWQNERAASLFAASLLMPARWIRADVGVAKGRTHDALAERYGVSRKALAIRLSNLGLMPDPGSAE
jgi:Zn-dependent peptidase ImmA (M78 family)